ncbi:MAG: GspH/FimT family pseudopilin [Patescibacteria group bacterium]
MRHAQSRKGITVVELVIVIAVIGVLSLVVFSPLARFRDSQVLVSTAEQVISLLYKARTDTIASKDAAQYGVHFEVGRAVLFKGATFTEPNSNNKELALPLLVRASTISLSGGGTDIVFDRLVGTTAQSGTIVLTLRNNASSTRTIAIGQTGTVELLK